MYNNHWLLLTGILCSVSWTLLATASSIIKFETRTLIVDDGGGATSYCNSDFFARVKECLEGQHRSIIDLLNDPVSNDSKEDNQPNDFPPIEDLYTNCVTGNMLTKLGKCSFTLMLQYEAPFQANQLYNLWDGKPTLLNQYVHDIQAIDIYYPDLFARPHHTRDRLLEAHEESSSEEQASPCVSLKNMLAGNGRQYHYQVPSSRIKQICFQPDTETPSLAKRRDGRLIVTYKLMRAAQPVWLAYGSTDSNGKCNNEYDHFNAIAQTSRDMAFERNQECTVETIKANVTLPVLLKNTKKRCPTSNSTILDINDYIIGLDHTLVEIKRMSSSVSTTLTSTFCPDESHDTDGIKSLVRFNDGYNASNEDYVTLQLELKAHFHSTIDYIHFWHTKVSHSCPSEVIGASANQDMSWDHPSEVARITASLLKITSRKECSIHGVLRVPHTIFAFKVCKGNKITLPTSRGFGGIYAAYEKVEIGFVKRVKDITVYRIEDSSTNVCEPESVTHDEKLSLKIQVNSLVAKFKVTGKLRGAKRLLIIVNFESSSSSDLQASDIDIIKGGFEYAIKQGVVHQSIPPYTTEVISSVFKDNWKPNNSANGKSDPMMFITPNLYSEHPGVSVNDYQILKLTQEQRLIPWPMIQQPRNRILSVIDTSDLFTDPHSFIYGWEYTVDGRNETQNIETHCFNVYDKIWGLLMTHQPVPDSVWRKPNVNGCAYQPYMLLKLKDSLPNIGEDNKISFTMNLRQPVTQPPMLKLTKPTMNTEVSWSSIVQGDHCDSILSELNSGDKTIKTGVTLLSSMSSTNQDCLFKAKMAEISLPDGTDTKHSVRVDITDFMRPDDELAGNKYIDLWTVTVHLLTDSDVDPNASISDIKVIGTDSEGSIATDLPFSRIKPVLESTNTTVIMEVSIRIPDMIEHDIRWLEFTLGPVLKIDKAFGSFYPIPNFNTVLPDPVATTSNVFYSLRTNNCSLSIPHSTHNISEVKQNTIPANCVVEYEAEWTHTQPFSNKMIVHDTVNKRFFYCITMKDIITMPDDDTLPTLLEQLEIPSPPVSLSAKLDPNLLYFYLNGMGNFVASSKVSLDSLTELRASTSTVMYSRTGRLIIFTHKANIIASKTPYLLIQLQHAPYFALGPQLSSRLKINTITTVKPTTSVVADIKSQLLNFIPLASFDQWKLTKLNPHCNNSTTNPEYLNGELDDAHLKYMTEEVETCEKAFIGTTTPTKGFTGNIIPCEDGRQLAIQTFRIPVNSEEDVARIALRNLDLICNEGSRGAFHIPESDLNPYEPMKPSKICSKDWLSWKDSQPMVLESNKNYFFGFDASKCKKDTFKPVVAAVLKQPNPSKHSTKKEEDHQIPGQIFSTTKVIKTEIMGASFCNDAYFSKITNSPITPERISRWLDCIYEYHTLPHGEIQVQMQFTPETKQMCVNENYAVVRLPKIKIPEGLDVKMTLQVEPVPREWECSDRVAPIILANLPEDSAKTACSVFSQRSAFERSFDMDSIPATDHTTLIYTLGSCNMNHILRTPTTATLKIRVDSTFQLHFLHGCNAAKSCLNLWGDHTKFQKCLDQTNCSADVLGVARVQGRSKTKKEHYTSYTIQIPDDIQYGDFNIVGLYSDDNSDSEFPGSCMAELHDTSSGDNQASQSGTLNVSKAPKNILLIAHEQPILKDIRRSTTTVELRITDPKCKLVDPDLLKLAVVESVRPSNTQRHVEYAVSDPPGWPAIMKETVYGLLGLSFFLLIVIIILSMVYFHQN